jgi:hypothetical protein
LPEGLARSLQQPIGSPGGDSLQVLSDLRRLRLRLDEEMNVVRHYHEGEEMIELADTLAIQDDRGYAFRDLRLFEPYLAERGVRFAAGMRRQGSVESQGNEKRRADGLRVRKAAAIFHVIVVVSSVENLMFFNN